MEQAHGVKERAWAVVVECPKSTARNAEKRSFLKKAWLQVQGASAGKLEPDQEDFVYV
jgi:hypothetical protein